MARAATAGELTLFRTAGQWSILRAAIFQPTTIYTARINQTFPSLDSVLEITYDGGVGTLSNVLPDMMMMVGSTAGAHDIGIVRVKDKDASKFYIGETSDVAFANDQYLTVINDFPILEKQVRLINEISYMDGSYAYTDQHTNFAPVPIMGSHRVLKMTGASISTQYNFASSYCLDSSISAYSCTSPTASSITGPTTSTPTVTFNTFGWHAVYLTVTAANGKSSFGIRYVYVWNEDNAPAEAGVRQCRCDADSGGWNFDVTLLDNADLDTIRDRALVILFTEDFYGDTNQSIGPVSGSENILAIGWITGESIDWNPQQGRVAFGVQGAHYWMQNIPAWPDGIRFTTVTPSAWTDMKDLTINKGLFHFLHWHTTATKIMDCFLTDNTLYTAEIFSLAQNLWEQINDIAFAQILARPGVNALGQLYIEVHPQLVPSASRTWPTVMTITTQDFVEGTDFNRVIVQPLSNLDLSGIFVNSSGYGIAYFSRSPGSAHPHYGKPEILDRLLLESQSQANTLCGLYYSWKNNQYPDIPISFQANNRLIDCFPRQKCAISIGASDTIRGITYSGGLIPTSVEHIYDSDNGYLHTEVTFESETSSVSPGPSITLVMPGSDDLSTPPTPPPPSFPSLPPIIPGVPELDPDFPVPLIIHDVNAGLIYTENILDSNPQFTLINAGLSSLHYGGGPAAGANRKIFVCPNGSVYFAKIDIVNNNAFLARAPSIGGTFTVIYEGANIPPGTGGTRGIWGMGYNPLVPETVAFVMGGHGSNTIYIGSDGSYSVGAVVNALFASDISYGIGYWVWTLFNSFAKFSADGMSLVSSGSIASGPSQYHKRALGGVILCPRNGTVGMITSPDNFGSYTQIADSKMNSSEFSRAMACDPTGMQIMTRYDTGAKGKSSDGGATWSLLSSLPPGNWWWTYAGGSSTGSRWVAAGGGSIRLSLNFGTTWLNREGNITSVVAIPNIDRVLAVGYH